MKEFFDSLISIARFCAKLHRGEFASIDLDKSKEISKNSYVFQMLNGKKIMISYVELPEDTSNIVEFQQKCSCLADPTTCAIHEQTFCPL